VDEPICVVAWDGLAMLAQQVLNENPCSGALFAFRGRRGGLVKLLWYDGQGLCLYAKRLDHGHFVWPVTDTGRVSLTPAQLADAKTRATPRGGGLTAQR
jgi:transposase